MKFIVYALGCASVAVALNAIASSAIEKSLSTEPDPVLTLHLGAAENQTTAVLGAGGCIRGPFTVTRAGRIVLDVAPGEFFPFGCDRQ